MTPSARPGIVLMVATALAMVVANSPWREAYFALWAVPVGLSVGGFSFTRDLEFLINDGLMAIFFFAVGLELRHELQRGALSAWRRAALPVAAALGGMLVPAGVFMAFNLGHLSTRGWGIPMATDIAFAVGVLALLGARVPPALRVMLLALAVIDDLGAILVIALFYSAGIGLAGLGALALGMTIIFLLQRLGAQNPWIYVPPAVVAWAGAYAMGIHPALAGALVGLVTPGGAPPGGGSSPAERLAHAFDPVVTYGIMPLFAFANAGVSVLGMSLGGDSWRVFLGVALGLLLGKPLGIVAGAALSVRAGMGALPPGMRFSDVTVVGCAGGIGFTMALFIAELAFPPGAQLEAAKLAVLSGSAAAAVAALALGRWWLRPR